MKNLLRIPIFLLFIVAITYSCKKDDLVLEKSVNTTNQNSGHIIFNISDQSASTRSNNAAQTILGDFRTIPFTVEKMAESHRTLYGSSLTEMETTNFYVKFSPSNLEDMTLLEQTDAFFYDFPLEYEVLEMGDYYQEVPEGSFPQLYAILPADFIFPNVTYEIIEKLYLDKSDLMLVAESFRTTGNAKDIKTYVFGSNGLKAGDIDDDIQGIPQEPDCPYGCTPVFVIDDSGANPPNSEWVCDCDPIEPPQTPEPFENDCGCQTYSNERKPGGCIKVEDTQLSTPQEPNTFEPVRRVKVIIKDTWFTQDVTWTDDNGCWKINKEYKGKAWMWVQFKNDRCKIRGTANNFAATKEWLATTQDYIGTLWGPIFNNIEVNFDMFATPGSPSHKFWGAATVNNALHEFYDEANIDGINNPPTNLDIYIGVNGDRGFALMRHFIGKAGILEAMGSGIQDFTGYFMAPFGPLTAYHSPIGIVTHFLPDVFIGVNFTNSDRLKLLAYHEFAHTSHYDQVGKEYWKELITAEVPNGHGTANSPDAGRIAICESWAEHIGLSYTHRQYGISNSSFFINWEIQLEATWYEVNNHIPIGIYHDLIDDGNEPTSLNTDNSGSTIVTDNVSGFTNAQMFSALNSTITTLPAFQATLIGSSLMLTPNTAQQVNELFDSY